MSDFHSASAEAVFAAVTEMLDAEAADEAREVFMNVLEQLRGVNTTAAIMACISDMIANTTSQFAHVFEFTLNTIGHPEAMAMVASATTVSLHLLAAAIEVRSAELVEAELFAGEWNEGGE
jgi:hypothetical protein